MFTFAYGFALFQRCQFLQIAVPDSNKFFVEPLPAVLLSGTRGIT